MKFSNLILSLSVIIFIVAASTARSVTIHVPADQPTIQAGIDAAVAGDTVLVADGTYTGPGNRDIDFGGKGIFVKSENGSDVTIIDCEGSILDRHRGFYFHRGEDTTAVVAGFTVLNGWEFQGGGILCEKNSSPTIMSNAINGNFRSGIWCVDSDPTISNNTINDNAGGGIWCEDSNPTISNNTISGNSGSGISLVNSSATIINNTISDNFSFFGGGIYCSNSSPIISNNIISENWDSAGGGGIFCESSSPSISNNTISRNIGSGISCSNSNPAITNNTIVGNSLGGLILSSNSSISLVNTIIGFNSGGAAVSCNTSSAFLTCCDVFGNSGGDWTGCIADQEELNNNFSADPLFCDTAAGDFHLSNFSQCLAQYSPCGTLVGVLDLGCDLGFLCADANGDSLVNVDDVEFLIAYYFYSGTAPFHLPASDLNCDGSVNIADITYLAAYLNGTGAPPCCAE